VKHFWILPILGKFLSNQRGEVPDTSGGEGDQGEPAPSPEPAGDAPAGDQPPAQEESFIDPASLPEELKPHWKRMHGQYTKFAQERKALREAQSMVERFNSDPAFALQTIQQRAAMMGYQLLQPGQNGQAQAPQVTTAQGGDIPNEFVQAIQSKLPPELHWMAPSIAQATYGAVQAGLKPLQEQQSREKAQQRDQVFDEQEAKMTEKYPGWEQHESEMTKLNSWLQSDSLSHPLYGSKLEILYKMATDQAASVSEAAKRLNAAARNRTSSSQVTSRSAPNIFKQVREAKSSNDAWDAAAKFAIDQVKGQGGSI